MDYKLFTLHKSITLNAPVTLSVKSAHFHQNKINCVLFEWMTPHKKARFALLNPMYEPLLDDTLTPQLMTLNLKDIKSIEINENFHYDYIESLKVISQVFLE
ncbi:MAG: hypothetical protein ACOCUE_00335, partial [Candidatus Izemoplasmataceae bacterium]